MASPQSEHGHTRIANELLEAALAYKIGGNELKIFFAVARFTYGWHRKVADMSYGFISRMTRIDRSHVVRACHALAQKNMITVQDGNKKLRTNKIGIQKDYEKWVGFPVDNFNPILGDSGGIGTIDSGGIGTIKHPDSGGIGTIDGGGIGTILLLKKPKDIRLNKPKERKSKTDRPVDNLKKQRQAVSKAIKGLESKINNGDPRALIDALTALGYDYERVWSTVVMARKANKPAAFLVAHLSNPRYAISDWAHDKAKAEIREFENEPLGV